MPIDPKTGGWPPDSETADCQMCGEVFPCDHPEDRVYCSPECSREAFGLKAAAGEIERAGRGKWKAIPPFTNRTHTT